jgi:hypothetical protein
MSFGFPAEQSPVPSLFIEELEKDGVIGRTIFSLWLDDNDQS